VRGTPRFRDSDFPVAYPRVVGTVSLGPIVHQDLWSGPASETGRIIHVSFARYHHVAAEHTLVDGR
jgi:hypothetical protein